MKLQQDGNGRLNVTVPRQLAKANDWEEMIEHGIKPDLYPSATGDGQIEYRWTNKEECRKQLEEARKQ